MKNLGKIFLFLPLFLVVLYQNCGDVSLVAPGEDPPQVYLKMQGSFCPSVVGNEAYLLQEFYIVNLTARVSRFSGRFLADSDMDGVADEDEITYGLNPLERRTFGILDAACLDAGVVNCDPGIQGTFLSFGLKTLDVEEQFGGGVYGEDQDQDKIPDLLELLFGTMVNVADGDISSDSPGGESNISEIKKGLAPRSNRDESLDSRFYNLYQTNYDSTISCPDNTGGYTFVIQQLPLIDTEAFTSSDPDESYLNHGAGENLIMMIVVSVKAGGEQQISYSLERVPFSYSQVDASVNPSDFILINQL